MNKEDYVILEGRTHGSYEYPDILVAKQRSLQGKNWHKAQEALEAEGRFMPTIRQYVDFLTLLKSGKAYDGAGKKINNQELDSILDDILTVRNPWRAEWLDASFSKQGQEFYISYHRLNQGKLEQVTEPLQECLMQDKTPGIDIESWLQNANEQGLPSQSTKQEKLYFLHPREGRVAGFGADSVRASLDCDGYPRGSGSALGVRECVSAEGAPEKISMPALDEKITRAIQSGKKFEFGNFIYTPTPKENKAQGERK